MLRASNNCRRKAQAEWPPSTENAEVLRINARYTVKNTSATGSWSWTSVLAQTALLPSSTSGYIDAVRRLGKRAVRQGISTNAARATSTRQTPPAYGLRKPSKPTHMSEISAAVTENRQQS